MSLQAIFDLYSLRRDLHRKPSEMRSEQTKKLREILEHAYRNVPFYHRKFDSAGVKPEDIRSIDDLSKIPTTTKSELQYARTKDITAWNFDIDKCVKRTTSGSTGSPLTIIVNKRTLSFEMALWNLALTENGFRPWHKMAVITDPTDFPKSKPWMQYLGLMRRKYLSVFDDPSEQSRILEDFEPNAIKGYPSSLVILANFLKQNSKRIKPHLIMTSAELADKKSKQLIRSTFEAEVLDNYASNEFSLMAWECREHLGYHINSDSLIMEFTSNEENVSPGGRGEIVCTGLLNRAMPLIRYRMGDVGILSEEQCACGRTLPLMKLIEGRTDDFLVALDGRIISPTVFFPYPFEGFEGLKQFRVIQGERDRLIFQLVLEEGFPDIDEKILERARKKIQRLFGEGMRVEFRCLKEIGREPSGKLRKVISNIPTA